MPDNGRQLQPRCNKELPPGRGRAPGSVDRMRSVMMYKSIYSTFLFFILICLRWWKQPARSEEHSSFSLSELIIKTLIYQEEGVVIFRADHPTAPEQSYSAIPMPNLKLKDR